MAQGNVLRIRLSLRGRPIKSYVFNKDCVVVGRDPDADVSLDNPGISRDHLKIERTQGGFIVQDLNSANGTFVNETQVQRQYLQTGDVIRVGKYSLWLSMEEERRGSGASQSKISSEALEGTTVLRTSELHEMMRFAQETEPVPPPEPAPVVAVASVPKTRARFYVAAGALTGFVVGAVLGAGIIWYVVR
jgi:predicted component of type VI protein secretion system